MYLKLNICIFPTNNSKCIVGADLTRVFSKKDQKKIELHAPAICNVKP